MKKFVSVAMVLAVLFAMTVVSVGAVISPQGKSYYDITVSTVGSGEAETDKNKVEVNVSEEDGTVTLTARDDKDIFVNWVVDGDYEVVSGDPSSRVFVIRPKSDIKAVAYFENSTTAATTVPASTNTGNTSPKTGDTLPLVIAVSALALGLGVFAVKKIKA